MAVSYSPNISKDGLVFCLDAGNRQSYPGSGTAWNELSNNMSAELVNSPTFNSQNNGFFQFVTNDYARIPNNTTLDTQTPSVEVWIKTNTTNQNGFWFEKGTVNTQYSLFQEGTDIVWRHNFSGVGLSDLRVLASNFINNTNWYQIVGTFISGHRRLYINSNLVHSDTVAGTVSTNSGGMSIGAYGGYSGDKFYYYNGNLAICKVYNKELTPAEILQNYNATKGRFGI